MSYPCLICIRLAFRPHMICVRLAFHHRFLTAAVACFTYGFNICFQHVFQYIIYANRGYDLDDISSIGFLPYLQYLPCLPYLRKRLRRRQLSPSGGISRFEETRFAVILSISPKTEIKENKQPNPGHFMTPNAGSFSRIQGKWLRRRQMSPYIGKAGLWENGRLKCTQK